MEDYSGRFGGGAGSSFVHPVVAAAMALTILLIFLLPRKYVIVPFLLTIFLTPFGQQYYIAGVHLFVLRILVLFGVVRAMSAKFSSRTDIFAGGFTAVDKIFLFWAIARAVATVLEFIDKQAFINQAGFLWDTIGGYILVRFFIRDEEDVVRVLKTFALIVCVLAVTCTGERLFFKNMFGYIGGRMLPAIREGGYRAQGTFEDPIRCGTFGATLLSLFAWLWWRGKSRFVALAGAVGGTVMVLMSASSTPLMATLAVPLGMLVWPMRKSMRAVRWGLIAFVICLQMVMKAPVWFAINHIDLVAGNSGYHRAMLIDQLVRHFGDWWLIGAKTTLGWGYDMGDQANQFVYEAESGGLVTLVAFFFFIAKGYSRIGAARKLVAPDKKKEWLFWLLGVALFSQLISFFGIAFNDQAVYGWFALFAIICTTTAPVLNVKPVEDELTLGADLTGTEAAYWPASVNNTQVTR